jgi:hypothetical protein
MALTIESANELKLPNPIQNACLVLFVSTVWFNSFFPAGSRRSRQRGSHTALTIFGVSAALRHFPFDQCSAAPRGLAVSIEHRPR